MVNFYAILKDFDFVVITIVVEHNVDPVTGWVSSNLVMFSLRAKNKPKVRTIDQTLVL